MVDSCSLTKRLSVSQQTGTAALPLLPLWVHTLAHKHTQAWKYAKAHTDVPTIIWTHTHTHTPIEFRSPSSGSPVPAVERRAILPFPLTAWAQCGYYLCAHTTPAGARPSMNMETPARCRFWIRPRVQKVQKIKVKSVPTEVIFTFKVL